MKRACVLGYLICVAVLIALSMAPLSATAYSQTKPQEADEEDLKVAYTIAFLKFLSHPERDVRPRVPSVHVCVIGGSEVSKAFARADGASLSTDEEKTLRVTICKESLNEPELENCWAVYVAHAHRDRIPDIARRLKGMGILLITESKGALNDGSMVNLLRVGDRLRWEMSRTAIEAEKLVMSSQIYRNALKVQ